MIAGIPEASGEAGDVARKHGEQRVECRSFSRSCKRRDVKSGEAGTLSKTRVAGVHPYQEDSQPAEDIRVGSVNSSIG